MSSSSDLETGISKKIVQKNKKLTKKKPKHEHKPASVPALHHDGKNEGDDPHWAYEPPEGAVLLDHTVDAGVFEWDAVNDDPDTEIWLIRVPDSIKAKHLDGLEIDPPSSSRTALVGNLARKNTTYNIWSTSEDDAELAGGDELQGLSCLLPRKRKSGKLYLAPKPVSRRIVVSAQPSVATPAEQQTIVNQNPPRTCYPKDVLKHAFVPYGARTQLEDPMDVDAIETAVDKPAAYEAHTPKVKLTKPKESKESKGKKRKVDVDSPKHKKSKKHKADS